MTVKRPDSNALSTPLQARGRWLLPLLMLSVLAAAATGSAAAYQYLSQPGRLPLRVVEVKGEFRQLRSKQIQQRVVDAIDGGFFSCDMPRLRAALLAMPWVADVSIRRVWPDTLSMQVREEVPLARWGRASLINADAGVFTPDVLADFADLPRLSGPVGSESKVVGFYRVVAEAALTRELGIRALELDARRHWWMTFDGGLVLALGRDDVEHRLAQFLRVYPSLVAQPSRQPARIDMRYAHGFAVGWREPAGGDAPAEGPAETGSPQGQT